VNYNKQTNKPTKGITMQKFRDDIKALQTKALTLNQKGGLK